VGVAAEPGVQVPPALLWRDGLQQAERQQLIRELCLPSNVCSPCAARYTVCYALTPGLCQLAPPSCSTHMGGGEGGHGGLGNGGGEGGGAGGDGGGGLAAQVNPKA
jgi:hypothetical protein